MSNHIAMWSGPRNISTALMRSFENRSDCFVSDEPFYPLFLNKTGFKHPLRDRIIESGQINYDEIVSYITGTIPCSKMTWYQKHMAHHIFPELDIKWVKKMKNCLLIRHPNDVISSYLKINDVHDIEQLGYLQQVNIYKMLYRKFESHPIIVDAKDLLLNPKSMLIALCQNLEIEFDEKMLSWPLGSRRTDGVWGEYWYKQVEASTKFKPYKKTKRNIPNKYKALRDECMKYYEFLHQKRIIINET